MNIIGALMAEMPQKMPMSPAERAAHESILENLKNKAANSKAANSLGISITPKEAVKTKAFWMIWLTWAFMGAAGISMVSLSKSYSVYLGITGVMALTSYNITNGVSRIIAGVLSDLIGRRRLGFLAFVLGGIGYAGLPFIHTLPMLCLLTSFVGFAFGTLFAVSGPLATDLFGLEYFGMIFGLVFTAYGFVGGLVGPLLASVVLSTTNSYLFVFMYLAVFSLLAGFFILGAKKK